MIEKFEAGAGRQLLRLLKAALILSVAGWALLGILGNVMDWPVARASVASVTSMSTFAGGSASWRATTNPIIVAAGTSSIVLFKALTATLCLAGAWRMWSARGLDPAAFGNSKALGLAGCMVAVFGLFVGWIVIGEGWFQLWRSDALRDAAAETAFRYGGLIALIGLLVAQRDC